MSFKLGDLAPPGLTRRCWRKVRYDTPEAADAALAMRREQAAANPHWTYTQPDLLERYRCRSCGAYHLGHNRYKLKEFDMSQTEALLKNGGVVTVLLGKGYDLPTDFVFNPQVRAVDTRGLVPNAVAGKLGSNTKAVIITDNIPAPVYSAIHTELKRRGLLYLVRRDQKALEMQLREFFPAPAARAEAPPAEQPPAAPPPAEKEEATAGEENEPQRRLTPKGVVPALVREFWEKVAPMGAAEGARLLWPVAVERKIPTTVGSLQQAIRMEKRKGGLTDRPASLTPKHLEVLRVFDDAVAGLQVTRDWIAEQVARTAENEARMAKVEEALRAIRGE